MSTQDAVKEWLYSQTDLLRSDGILVLEAGDLIDGSLLETPVPFPTTLQANKNFIKIQRVESPIGQDPGLISLIGDYFGRMPVLKDTSVVYSLTTDMAPKQSQLFHRDPPFEGKLAIVFIYLCDVTPLNGPFTYVKGTHSVGRYADIEPKRVEKIRERDLRVTDSEMRAAIPESEWVVCTGPKHTMVIADTIGYHKGPKILEGDRLVLRFTYK